jgi:hypothetical protein
MVPRKTESAVAVSEIRIELTMGPTKSPLSPAKASRKAWSVGS